MIIILSVTKYNSDGTVKKYQESYTADIWPNDWPSMNSLSEGDVVYDVYDEYALVQKIKNQGGKNEG